MLAYTLLHHIHFLAPLAESPRHSSGAVSLSQRLEDVGVTGATSPCIQATVDSGTSERGFSAGHSSTLRAAGLR